MASTYMTPGGAGANLNVTKWERTIEGALYDRWRAIPNFKESAEKLMDGLWVRRMGRIAMQTILATGDGTGFEHSDAAPTRVQITPTWCISSVAHPDHAKWREGNEIDPAYAATCEKSLAAGVENLILQLVSSASNTYGSSAYNIDATGLRSVLTSLATNSYQDEDEGIEAGDTDLHLMLDTGQIAHALAIPEINNAYQRGDGKSPLVTGRMGTGLGFNFMFSTLLATAAGAKQGLAWKKPAIKYGWNKRPSPEKQRFLKQVRLMCDAEIGGNIIYNELMVAVRTA